MVPDKDIRVIDFEELQYPLMARAARIQGVVVIRVKLDRNGNVTGSEAISGAELLARVCLENAKKWRFQPNPEGAAVIIYHFSMPGGICKSASSLFIFSAPNIATIIGCDVPVSTTERN